MPGMTFFGASLDLDGGGWDFTAGASLPRIRSVVVVVAAAVVVVIIIRIINVVVAAIAVAVVFGL